jgi:hypothetical protein
VTLSESTDSALESPIVSPDWPAESAPNPCGAGGRVRGTSFGGRRGIRPARDDVRRVFARVVGRFRGAGFALVARRALAFFFAFFVALALAALARLLLARVRDAVAATRAPGFLALAFAASAARRAGFLERGALARFGAGFAAGLRFVVERLAAAGFVARRAAF